MQEENAIAMQQHSGRKGVVSTGAAFADYNLTLVHYGNYNTSGVVWVLCSHT